MPVTNLERAVARATGETCREIRRLGFALADPQQVEFDPEPFELPPQVVDWDDVDAQRPALFP